MEPYHNSQLAYGVSVNSTVNNHTIFSLLQFLFYFLNLVCVYNFNIWYAR